MCPDIYFMFLMTSTLIIYFLNMRINISVLLEADVSILLSQIKLHEQVLTAPAILAN